MPPPSLSPLDDPRRALLAALARPLGAAPLRDLARGARTVAIAVPDGTRRIPADVIVPALLDELAAAGITGGAVSILVGCGAHRTTSPVERLRLAGGDRVAAARVRLLDAQAHSPASVSLGSTSLGCPLRMAKTVADADLVVSVGVVEPHLYAGFSGGVKGVAIGCAGAETITWTHAPAFISRPGVEPMALAGNPFQATLREIAAATGLGFAVNVAASGDGRPAHIVAGDPAAAQEDLAHRCATAWLHEVDHAYDVVVAGIPAPKHESLYQASRAATYLALTSRPAVRDGGLIVLCSDLPKGAGDGPGERRFADLLAAETPGALIARGLRETLGPGGQRAFVVAKVLQRYRIAVAGAADPGELAALGFGWSASAAEAIAEPLHPPLGAAGPGTGGAPRSPTAVSDGRSTRRVLVVADAMATIVRRRRQVSAGVRAPG